MDHRHDFDVNTTVLCLTHYYFTKHAYLYPERQVQVVACNSMRMMKKQKKCKMLNYGIRKEKRDEINE